MIKIARLNVKIEIWIINGPTRKIRRKMAAKNGCNCPKEAFTPSSRTFGHNSPPGRRLSSRKKETGGREMTGRGGKRTHTDTRRSRMRRERNPWFASLWNLEMGVCRRSAVASNPPRRLMKFLSQSFAIGWRNDTRRKKKIFFPRIFPSISSVSHLEKELTEERPPVRKFLNSIRLTRNKFSKSHFRTIETRINIIPREKNHACNHRQENKGTAIEQDPVPPGMEWKSREWWIFFFTPDRNKWT